jgi:hypothetical protein
LAENYMQYLKSEGYVPTIDEDGDVRFKFEGKLYFLSIEEEDETFFKLVFPMFWTIDSEEERARVCDACVHASRQTKVAKVFTVLDNTWAAVELFLPSVDDMPKVFPRSMRALRSAVEEFAGRMRGESSPS